MKKNALRRALIAVVASTTVFASLVAGMAPASAQSGGPGPDHDTNPGVFSIMTSPDLVAQMIVITTDQYRAALTDATHAAVRLVRPRTWGERSADVAVLQTMIEVDLVDGLYGPATAAAHREVLVAADIDPTDIVPGASLQEGPTATTPAPRAAAPPAEPSAGTVTADPVETDSSPAADLEATDPAEPADEILTPPPGGPSPEQWAALRFCESSGDYTVVNPTGTFRGAYQFSQQTWNWIASEYAPHLVGVDPAAASPADQDFMAHTLYAVGGPGHWPVCGRYLY